MRKTLVAIMLAALVGVVAPSALAATGGKAEAAKRCQLEWQTLRGANGQTFKNRGECAAHAARGGVFAQGLTITIAYSEYEDPLSPQDLYLATHTITGLTAAPGAEMRVVIVEADGTTSIDVVVPTAPFLAPFDMVHACEFAGAILTITDLTTGASGSAVYNPPASVCND